MSVAFLSGLSRPGFNRCERTIVRPRACRSGHGSDQDRAPGGDPAARMPPFARSADGKQLSTTFAHLNAGKASKVLDLDREADRAEFRRMVETADVVLESFQPGELDAKGLGYKSLAAINPGL